MKDSWTSDFIYNNADLMIKGLYVLIALIVIVFIANAIKEMMRKNEIKDYCKTRRINYSPSLTTLPSTMKNISDLQRGEKNYYEAVMSGTKNDIQYYTFDYKYMIRISHNSVIYRDETVCILLSKKAGFPEFRLYEKKPDPKFLGLISINIPKEDFIIKEDYIFSEKFVLSGESEEKVKSFFDEKTRKCFMENFKEDYVWIGNKDYLLIRNIGKRLNLKDRLIFFNKCLKLFTELTSDSSNNQFC